MSEIDFDDIKEKKAFYHTMRGLANDNIVRNGKALDYITFAFTGGALLMLANIIGDFDYYRGFLLLSFILLILALLCHSFSYEQSIKYNKKVVKNLDDWYNRGLLSSYFELPSTKEYEGRSALDQTSFWFMISGILSLAIFIILNTML